MKVNVNPIIQAECEDCGITLVLEPEFLTIFELDEEYIGVTICANCERPIISDMPDDLVDEIEQRGVKILHWINND